MLAARAGTDHVIQSSLPTSLRAARRIWLNGRLYDDPADAVVPATDHGLVVGNGIFETLKVTDAGLFAITRHLNRLTRSAGRLGPPRPDHDVVREGIAAVVDGRSYQFGKLRITYTGGPGPLGSQAPYGPPTLVVAADAAEPPAPTADIVTAPWLRNERGALAGVKSTSYAENVRALAYAHEQAATKRSSSTPPATCARGPAAILPASSDPSGHPAAWRPGRWPGITRELLLEWCAIVESDVTPAEAARADEVFITSSLRDVQAVRAWDGVGTRRPGPRPADLAAGQELRPVAIPWYDPSGIRETDAAMGYGGRRPRGARGRLAQW